MESRTLTLVTPQRVSSGLGTRLRQLRVAAGLTQSDLARDRFSKEYVSQIERGKTRPTPQTLAWIAERLGVDASYLETGQTWDEYAEVEAAVTRAEAAVEGEHFDEVLDALEGITHSPEARDLAAAREDIERALELADRIDDTLTVAHVTFQASLVAERDGQWLRARTLAERAKELYEAHGDRKNVGRLLNNLGGLNYLLGKP